MCDNDILIEIKKAIDLFMDKTYTEADFYGHILQIIRENHKEGLEHKKRLEYLLFKLDELQANQQMYWNGHRDLLPTCKAQEKELVLKKQKLLATGYNIMRFKIAKPVQQKLL